MREAVVPLIEDVLAKKLGQALTFAKEELAQPAPVQKPVGEVNRYGLDSHGRKWHGMHWYDPNVDVPHGTKLYATPPAASVQGPYSAPVKEMWPVVPDAIGPHEDELPAYAAGWNDCRAEMLKGMKP